VRPLLSRRFLLGEPHDLVLLLRRDLPRFSRSRPIPEQAFDPVRFVAVEPAHHRGWGDTNLRADLCVLQTGGRSEDDPRTLNYALSDRARADETLQLRLVAVAQLGNSNGHWHTRQSNMLSAKMHEISATLH
jgi:hypothetical protein